MKVSELRKMSDKELEEYLQRFMGDNACSKCGEYVEPTEKRHIYIGRYGAGYGQRNRKLCTLCEKRYLDLLNYLDVPDIDWRN